MASLTDLDLILSMQFIVCSPMQIPVCVHWCSLLYAKFTRILCVTGGNYFTLIWIRSMIAPLLTPHMRVHLSFSVCWEEKQLDASTLVAKSSGSVYGESRLHGLLSYSCLASFMAPVLVGTCGRS